VVSIVEKFKGILKLTVEHSANLGVYVALYKSLLCIIRNIRKHETPLNSLLAGALAGGINTTLISK